MPEPIGTSRTLVERPYAPEVGGARLEALRSRTGAMVEDLGSLVAAESPSSDLAACRACAAVVAGVGTHLLGVAPTWVEAEGRPHLLWRGEGPTSVVLVGHLDTVWPAGTTAAWPFTVDRAAGTATGPGAFDMKGGLVQGLHALATLDGLDGVAFLVTSDEEVGSLTSRSLVEDVARGARAALVLEPPSGGALKTSRKGVSMYLLEVEGRAAHAGLEPERGVNAMVELAAQVSALTSIARAELGTTVTPTSASAGTATNVVPALATVAIDVRVRSADEQARVDAALRDLVPTVAGARLVVHGGPNRPPLPASASAGLFAVAARLADELGLGPLVGVEVGGASDGNFTAGIGVPTLDGLGSVGDGAHALGEHVVVGALAERAALVAELVEAIRAGER